MVFVEYEVILTILLEFKLRVAVPLQDKYAYGIQSSSVAVLVFDW